MNPKKSATLTLTALSTVAIILTAVAAAVLNTQTVPSHGTITGSAEIDVYSDQNATTTCSSINWGTLSPGYSTTQTIYIKNTGNLPQTLSMNTTAWNPTEANTVLTLTWNKEGTSIAADEVIAATLNLTAASDTGTLLDFSFDIKVYGSN
jgi:archaellum component FlaG (FlaF/FlaG flagellin family)